MGKSNKEDSSQLLRVCAAWDGRIKANFEDNQIILLSGDGSCFEFIDSNGHAVRQSCQYTVSPYRKKLGIVMDFRNMHFAKPFIVPVLRTPKKYLFELGYSISQVRWPQSLEACIAQNLLQTTSSGHQLSTIDGNANLVVRTHGKRFAVLYPLLIHKNDSTMRYTYRWTTQIFVVQHCPNRWVHPLRLVQAWIEQQKSQGKDSAGSGQADSSSNILYQHGEQTQAYAGQYSSQEHRESLGVQNKDHVTFNTQNVQQQQWQQQQQQFQKLGQLPQNERTLQAGQSSMSTHVSTKLPEATRQVVPTWGEFPTSSWWRDCNSSLLPSDVGLMLEWTPEALIQYLHCDKEVVVTVHADNSVMVSYQQGQYFRHYRPDLSEPRIYRWDAAPLHMRHEGRKTYRLQDIVLRANYFREASCRAFPEGVQLTCISHDDIQEVQKQDLFQGNEEEQYTVSTEIVERQSVPSHGDFIAYADGRVRVVFHDRTLVELDPTRQHAHITLKNGNTLQVRTSNPLQAKPYVQAALEFATWAFQHPEQVNYISEATQAGASVASKAYRLAADCAYTQQYTRLSPEMYTQRRSKTAPRNNTRDTTSDQPQPGIATLSNANNGSDDALGFKYTSGMNGHASDTFSDRMPLTRVDGNVVQNREGGIVQGNQYSSLQQSIQDVGGCQGGASLLVDADIRNSIVDKWMKKNQQLLLRLQQS